MSLSRHFQRYVIASIVGWGVAADHDRTSAQVFDDDGTTAQQVRETFHSVGLIRLLEETPTSSASDRPVVEPVVAELSTAATNGIVNPSPTDPTLKPPADDRGPISVGPLRTPDIDVAGIGTGIHPEDVTLNRMPAPQALPTGETRAGSWNLSSKAWVPGGFCHQPLYFEDPMLERHGHERWTCLQPMISGFRFFGTFPTLPYLATLRHPLEEVHTLGAYRPGSPAPLLRYRPHYDPAALRNEVISAGAAAVAIP